MTLTADQINTMKATEPIINGHGNALCTVFYENMLKAEPSLEGVFSQKGQATGAQPRALAGALLAYARHIDDLNAVGPAIERICHKHASLCIRPEQYAIVGKYLLEAMAALLGEDGFTTEIKEAWTAAYWQLANLMKSREAQLYEESPEWTDWRDFEITDKVREAEDIMSVYLKPKDGKPLPPFLPGQYVSLSTYVPILGYHQARQFSLSDRPNPEWYRISVKREVLGLPEENRTTNFSAGVISTIIHDELKIGATVKLSRPRGEFFIDVDTVSHETPLVTISAGVGQTPMLSIMNALAFKGYPTSLSWIHVARNSRAHAFSRHVEVVASQSPTKVHKKVFYSRPLPTDRQGVEFNQAGRLHVERLDDKRDLLLGESSTPLYLVCGPGTFMREVSEGLKAKGIPEANVSLELFGTGGLAECQG